jgi:shikimate kinase
MRPEQSIPLAIERIVLVGFMGAGKSTTGPILAQRLGWRFVDADHQLQAQTQSTIADLFDRLGEPAFRQMETVVVARLLKQRDVVVSLGGGAIETGSTRSLLGQLSGTCVVFLKAPLEVLIDRCERQEDAALRPVLKQREALDERFRSRLPHYEKAHITVETEDLAPNAVVDRILQYILEYIKPKPFIQKAIAT